jgi:cytochrome c oxidase subunit 2
MTFITFSKYCQTVAAILSLSCADFVYNGSESLVIFMFSAKGDINGMKKWLAFAFVLVMVAIVAACGSNAGEKSGGNIGSELKGGDLSADSSAATSEVVITASNWKFDQEEYKIKSGDTVNLTLKSAGGSHGVLILKSGYDQIGNDETLAVKFDEPGTYDIICSVPCGNGHRTMKSKLVIE